jgi:hypothetical protein
MTGVIPRVRRRPVVAEPLIGSQRYDYADAFEVRLESDDARSAEDVFRAGLEQAPASLRALVLIAHRHILRFELGPSSSSDHVLGWQILASEPDVVHLSAAGPLLRGVLVGRKVGPTAVVLTTFVYYRHPAARIIWAIVGPLHRRVAPYLLRRAAASGPYAASTGHRAAATGHRAAATGRPIAVRRSDFGR